VLPAHAREAARPCDPPRTHVALVPLTDATDRTWAAWSGAEPAAIVLHMLSDSLEKSRGRKVTRLTPAPGPAARPVDDSAAIAAAKAAHAEVVVTGSVTAFELVERREGGKFSRWGTSALEARARALVRVTLRVLDANSGDVILETTIERERNGRGTSSAERPRDAQAPPSGLLARALEDVMHELVRALDQRLDRRWQALVLGTGSGRCVLDAGSGRGLFVGQRLDVWRSGVDTYDEDLVRLSEEVRVGSIEIVSLEGRGRAHARVLEGEVSFGDQARPCTVHPSVASTLKR
jgi:hypothetical protein